MSAARPVDPPPDSFVARRRSARRALRLDKAATFQRSSVENAADSDEPVPPLTALRRSPTVPLGDSELDPSAAAANSCIDQVLHQFQRVFVGLGSDEPLPSEDRQHQSRGLFTVDQSTPACREQSRLELRRAFDRGYASSDSGIGSSASESEASPSKTMSSSYSPIPRLDGLSVRSCRQIEHRILFPIMHQEPLVPFHALVRTMPQRMRNKQIICLRDLEKELLCFLGPNYAIHKKLHKSAYLRFGEFTIQCLHSTLPYLPERDHCRPEDPPYTNGYFLDLVEQMRRYAAIIGQSRERRVNRRDGDRDPQDTHSSGDELALEDGLAATGRPAELVRRKKSGKSLSLRTDEEYKADMPALKRTLSGQTADEGVERSMARRKKNEPPLNINKRCEHCGKVFKRPCDFTKHEKTHSRPWKCHDPTCKYYSIGWPTEKERARHVNDKHSIAPPMFKCHFPDCPYESKRESNCKQHMEKAHGWEYLRSKNNARGSRPGQTSPAGASLATPSVPSLASPTVNSVPAPYPPPPATSHQRQPDDALLLGAVDGDLNTVSPGQQMPATPDLLQMPPQSGYPLNTFGEDSTDFAEFEAWLAAGNPSELTLPDIGGNNNSATGSSWTSPPMGVMDTPELQQVDNFYNPFSMNVQLDQNQVAALPQSKLEPFSCNPSMALSPPSLASPGSGLSPASISRSASSPGLHGIPGLPSMAAAARAGNNPKQHLSPVGSGNVMLYSPSQSQQQQMDFGADCGYTDPPLFDSFYKQTDDFALYPAGNTAAGADSAMFPPLGGTRGGAGTWGSEMGLSRCPFFPPMDDYEGY